MTKRAGLKQCALYAFDMLQAGTWNEAVILRVDAGKYYTVMDDTDAGKWAQKVAKDKARIVLFVSLGELRSLLKTPSPDLFQEGCSAS